MKLEPYIAHRGAKSLAPENTLAAFEAAHQVGAKWVEFDVQLTKCGTPVVFHDSHLGRTTNMRGWIKHKTYLELRILDAGSWFRSDFQGTYIPTLREALTYLKSVGISPNIEIKPQGHLLNTIVTSTLQILEEVWQNDYETHPVLISSFCLKTLKLIKSQAAHLPIGILYEALPEKSLLQHHTKYLRPYSVHCYYEAALKQIDHIRFLQDQNYKICVYTVNDKTLATQLLAHNIDAIITDYIQDYIR